MLSKIQFNRDLFRSIFTLISGTAAAQFIAFLLQPVLRRLFIPEEWGAFAVYISLVSIISTLSTFRYEPAIVDPSEKKEAVNLFFLAFYINLVFCLLLFLVVFFFLDPLAGFLNLSSSYAWWLLFLPLSIFMFGTYQAINYYLVREKAFGAISFNKAMRRTSEGLIQIPGGFFRWPAGLVLGDIAGHLANVVSGIRQLKKASFESSLHSFKLQLSLFKKYSDYPLYYMLPMSLNVICMMAPMIFINKFYSQEIAGYFDLTRLVLVIPSALLTVSVGQVFLQSISHKKREGLSFKRDFYHLLGILTISGALMTLIISLTGPWLLALYAGPAYETAGVYARILVWGTFARIVVSPMTMVYVGLRKLKTQAIWQLIYFFMVMSLVFFRNLDVKQFILILALIEVAAYSLNMGMIWSIFRRYHNEGLKVDE